MSLVIIFLLLLLKTTLSIFRNSSKLGHMGASDCSGAGSVERIVFPLTIVLGTVDTKRVGLIDKTEELQQDHCYT